MEHTGCYSLQFVETHILEKQKTPEFQRAFKMNQIFDNPPLLEIIAELSWKPHNAPVMESPIPVSKIPQASDTFEKVNQRFTSKLGSMNYHRIQRLLPPGFPLLPYTPVYRFSRIDHQNTLFQLGPCLFSANAVPPYKSWRDFEPIVQKGVAALLESRSEESKNLPVSLSLRYIDAFGEELVGTQTLMQFINETLGIEINLPKTILEKSPTDKEIIPAISLTIPLDFGKASLSISQGIVSEKSVFVMDTAVSFDEQIEPNIEQIMHAFGEARTVIHELFIGLTKKIQDKMKPVKED